MRRVAIGIPSAEMPRYGKFWDSLLHMRGISCENVIWGNGGNVSRNRNNIAKRALHCGFTEVFYVDDDSVLLPDTLERLQYHDLDIVSGLYLQRSPPYFPHVYVSRGDNMIQVQPLTNGLKGIVEASVVGAGCLLVKCNVFKKMAEPWWRLGETNQVDWADDTGFCLRAREAGFKIWADLDVRIGHCLTGDVWPRYNEETGDWTTVVVQNNQTLGEWPQVVK